MHLQKTGFVLGIVLLLGIFIAGVAYAAPDMSQWEGKWFSFQMTKKGVVFDGYNFRNVTEKSSGYIKFESWNPDEEKFEISIYSNNSGGEQETRYMHFYAGNDLRFLFRFQDEETQFVGQIQGKATGGILSSATIKTLGGVAMGSDDNEYGAGSVNLTAKMVAESKVKLPTGNGGGNGVGNFIVPRAAIKIDGSMDDWTLIQPAYVDKLNDEDPGANFVGTDLKGVYLARDDEFLYIMFTLNDGNPNEQVLYTFEAVPVAGNAGVEGDYLALAIFQNGAWRSWIGVRGNSQLNVPYPADYVGIGNGFIEWKVKLSDFQLFNGRYIMAGIGNYIPGIQPISDSAKPGVRLYLN